MIPCFERLKKKMKDFWVLSVRNTKHLMAFKSRINFPPPDSVPCPHPALDCYRPSRIFFLPFFARSVLTTAPTSFLPGNFLLLHNLLHAHHHLRRDFSERACMKSSPLYFHSFLPPLLFQCLSHYSLHNLCSLLCPSTRLWGVWRQRLYSPFLTYVVSTIY